MREQIRVECSGSALLSIDDIREFQGELKTLSRQNYKRLKNSILELGISSVFYIWEKHPREYMCFDGHQRLRTLKEMRHEGYDIPLVPIVFVLAKSEKEAKKKLLALASQYGQVDQQGLYELMEEVGITYDEIDDLYSFPEVDYPKFKAEYYEEDHPVKEEEEPLPDGGPVHSPPHSFDQVKESTEVKGKRIVIIIDCPTQEIKDSLKENLRPAIESVGAKLF